MIALRTFLRELRQRDAALYWVGWLHLVLLLVLALIAPFDQRIVTGINPWIKPMKFSFSNAAFLWTVGWFQGYLLGPRWAKRLVSFGISLAMLAEIVLITMQAARGTTSHYNVATTFDAAVFAWMGLMIALNTAMAALFLLLFCFARRAPLPAAYLWGIRLGLLLFLAGSLEGVVMIARSSHTVGAPDGGPGLPLVNWSSQAGDLRATHLLGLHSFQVIPLVGWFLSRLRSISLPAQVASVVAFAALYASLAVHLFLLALRGEPLLRL
ncbi:MAG: hypothetical protein L0387_18925 [Acidobacteria bacterium]|nr:hypothetical protein [Acidobacteriota bacterium]